MRKLSARAPTQVLLDGLQAVQTRTDETGQRSYKKRSKCCCVRACWAKERAVLQCSGSTWHLHDLDARVVRAAVGARPRHVRCCLVLCAVRVAGRRVGFIWGPPAALGCRLLRRTQHPAPQSALSRTMIRQESAKILQQAAFQTAPDRLASCTMFPLTHLHQHRPISDACVRTCVGVCVRVGGRAGGRPGVGEECEEEPV